jgi:hypothetical protein
MVLQLGHCPKNSRLLLLLLCRLVKGAETNRIETSHLCVFKIYSEHRCTETQQIINVTRTATTSGLLVFQ